MYTFVNHTETWDIICNDLKCTPDCKLQNECLQNVYEIVVQERNVHECDGSTLNAI
jgi:hypothetical protein